MSDAIMGTFVTVKTMADGTPRIVLDLQCTLSEIAAMGLIPGVPFALARMTKEASVTPPVEPKTKPGPLCIMACNFCEDPVFWNWIHETSTYPCASIDQAKVFILENCEIESRKQLDTLPPAAADFHRFIREPFLAWKAKQ